MTESLLNDQVQVENITDDQAFEMLTGPGGKYDKTKYASEAEMYKAMAKGKVLADHTVSQRNAENELLRKDFLELREVYNTGPKLQELIDQLAEQRTTDRGNQNANENVDKPNVDLKIIEDTVQAKLREIRDQERQVNNLREVKSKLSERYGENYNSFVREQADKLNMTVAEMEALAVRNPTLFYRAVGIEDKVVKEESFQAPPKSGQRSDSFSPNVPKRNWAYYQKMQKENPRLYADPKTHMQKLDDLVALGKDFYSA